MNRHILSAIDAKTSVRLFSDYDKNNDFYQIKDYYSEFVCGACGRIDEIQALMKPDLRISGNPLRKDIFVSHDGIFVVHNRLRYAISEFDDTLFSFFAIVNYDCYYAMIPKLVNEPYFFDDSFVAIGAQCNGCHRYREVIGGPGIPRMHCDRLTAYRLDKIVGCDFELIINNEFRDILKSCHERFRGIRFFSF